MYKRQGVAGSDEHIERSGSIGFDGVIRTAAAGGTSFSGSDKRTGSAVGILGGDGGRTGALVGDGEQISAFTGAFVSDGHGAGVGRSCRRRGGAARGYRCV